jgi:cysteine desulfurase family protein (TIGR01976 family)
MTALNLPWIRDQFPALSQTINSQPAVFFDGPGGTQVTQSVIQAIVDYLTYFNANEGGAFATSTKTEAILVDAHQAMADFLGCDADEVVFGYNMTTLTFALSRSIGRDLQSGDEIIVTSLDHDANVAPWKALEEKGIVVRMVDIHLEDCTLNLDHLRQLLNDRTRLVAVGYASNAVGTINDVAEIVKLAHSVGAMAFIDAVHYGPHGAIDVKQLDCDFLACSPYKFFGPHMGTLYGKREHLTRLQPYKLRPSPNELPIRWETGTQNHEGMAGVTAAVNYLAELGRQLTPNPPATRRAAITIAMDAIRQYELDLCSHLIPGLLQIPGLTLYGIRDTAQFIWRTPTVAFRLANHTPAEVAKALAEQGIFSWNGNYYAINVSERLGVESSGGMVRAGLVHYNTPAEIDRFVSAVHTLAQKKA